MIAEKMKGLVANSSAIRAMFEEATAWRGSTGRRMCLISVWETPMCRRRSR